MQIYPNIETPDRLYTLCKYGEGDWEYGTLFSGMKMCQYMYLYICIYMCRYVWIYPYAMNTYVCVNAWICEEYTCVCVYTHMCIHKFIQVYMYTHFHAWDKVADSQSLSTSMRMCEE